MWNLRSNIQRQREAMRTRAQEVIALQHAPRLCAETYADAIENFYHETRYARSNLLDALVKIPDARLHEKEWMGIAKHIAQFGLQIKCRANQKNCIKQSASLIAHLQNPLKRDNCRSVCYCACPCS
jgi:hypothetical protein